MTDEQITTPPDDESGESPTGRSVEEVEQFWRNRVSAEAKAHNDALAKLRTDHAAEVAAAKDAASAAAKGSQMTEAEQWAAEKLRLEDELKAEKAGRVIDTRKAKYQQAAEFLGDDILAATEEDKLEALELRLTTPGVKPPARMDANNAAKLPAGTPASEDKSSADLKADLERMAPEFAAQIGSSH